jgi:hypothetical protein
MTKLWQDQEYIFIPVTIRNLADHVLYFDRQDDFNDKFTRAKIKTLRLIYGESNYEAYYQPYYIGTENLGFACGINTMSKVTSMSPNETISGFVCFIMGQYYSPKELVCRESFSTIFTIAMNGTH